MLGVNSIRRGTRMRVGVGVGVWAAGIWGAGVVVVVCVWGFGCALGLGGGNVVGFVVSIRDLCTIFIKLYTSFLNMYN